LIQAQFKLNSTAFVSATIPETLAGRQAFSLVFTLFTEVYQDFLKTMIKGTFDGDKNYYLLFSREQPNSIVLFQQYKNDQIL
jgi:hypothetical protein